MDFPETFQMESYIFVIFNRFYALFWIWGCFHWLSSPIRLGNMANQSFCAKILATVGSRRIQGVNACVRVSRHTLHQFSVGVGLKQWGVFSPLLIIVSILNG